MGWIMVSTESSQDDIKKALIARLKNFNEWRRGGDMDMPSPLVVGLDIDMAISLLEETLKD